MQRPHVSVARVIDLINEKSEYSRYKKMTELFPGIFLLDTNKCSRIVKMPGAIMIRITLYRLPPSYSTRGESFRFEFYCINESEPILKTIESPHFQFAEDAIFNSLKSFVFLIKVYLDDAIGTLDELLD